MNRYITSNAYISTSALYNPSSAYLAHHGIKGQKWGVRRYQNEDGSLTEAGVKRYNSGTYAKSLNRLDTDISKTIHKRARNEIAIQKASRKGDAEKVKELENARKIADKAIASGRKTQESILKEARKNNVPISTKKTIRYVNTGKMAFAQFVAGIPGSLTVGMIDAAIASRYGAEAGGFVEGTKYKSRL